MSDKNKSTCNSITEFLQSNLAYVILIIVALVIMINEPPHILDGGENSAGFEMIGGLSSLESISQDYTISSESLDISKNLENIFN